MNEEKKLRRLPKRVLSFVLTLAMVLTLMPFGGLKVSAAGTEWSEIKDLIAGSYYQRNNEYEDEYIIEAADTMEGTVIKYHSFYFYRDTGYDHTISITSFEVNGDEVVLSLSQVYGFNVTKLYFSLSNHTVNDGWDTYPFVIHVTGVTLNKSTISLTPGTSETLVAEVSPSNASNKDVTWSTSDASVATVTDGVVTAVSAGTATITVTTVDRRKTASCTVTVLSHAHDWSGWKFDSTQHWKECSVCTEKNETANHNWVRSADGATTSCECGAYVTVKATSGVTPKTVKDCVTIETNLPESPDFIVMDTSKTPAVEVALTTSVEGNYQAVAQVQAGQNPYADFTLTNPKTTAATGDNRPIELLFVGFAAMSVMAAAAFTMDRKRR